MKKKRQGYTGGTMNTDYCLYYTATVERKRCWLLTSILRGTEHIAFDRSLDPTTSTFEFFVPVAMDSVFLELMVYMQKQGMVWDLQQLPNRYRSGD